MGKSASLVVSILLLLFGLLSLAIHLRLLESIDWESLAIIQNVLPRWLDVPLSFVTLLGSAEITGLIFLVIVTRAPTAQRLPLIFSFGLATLIEFVGKTFINQPTTPDYLVRYVRLLPILILSEKISPEFSFPSGHAIRSMIIILVLARKIADSRFRQITKRAIYIAIIIFEIVMLVSRVYLAEHWTTDVVGGALLGAACAFIAMELKIPLPRFLRHKLF